MTYQLTQLCRVKLPKTFLAVNLSDAFTFEENERQGSDNDVLEMKVAAHKHFGPESTRPNADNDIVMGNGTEDNKEANP